MPTEQTSLGHVQRAVKQATGLACPLPVLLESGPAGIRAVRT
jgi:hypothetical protein